MADVYFSRGNKLLPTTDKSVVRIFNLPAISIRNSLGNIDKSRPNICIEAPESELPVESDAIKHCVLGKLGETCATCGMKCYLENMDIVAVAR